MEAGSNSWTLSTQGMYGGCIYALAVSPNYADDHTLFAATWGDGVFKSTDGGASWFAVSYGLTDLTVKALAISPQIGDNTIFAGTNAGVFKSTTYGLYWVSTPLTYPIHALAISPGYAGDQTVFAGTWGYGVFKSTDGGANWTQIVSGLTDLYVYSLALSPGFTGDDIVLAGTGSAGIFRSTDGGLSWSKVQSVQAVKALTFASAQEAFAGVKGGIYKSTDGGANWSASGDGLPVGIQVTGLVASPHYAVDRTVFAVTEGGGIYRSTDGGATWEAVSSDWLPTSYLYGLAISPNYADDRTVFAGTWGSGVFKSTDSGATWTGVNQGLTNVWVFALVRSPNFASDHTVFAGTWNGIYKSTDGGMTWSNLAFKGQWIQALAISPNFASDHTIFAGASYGVIKSINGGASWWTCLDGVNVKALAISPNYVNDRTVFAGTWGHGVYRTWDRGNTWTQVNTGITNPYIRTLAISPNYHSDNTILAGTDSGVFKSTNAGNWWTAMNKGLTKLWVHSLAFSPGYADDHTIFVGTGGGGVFKSTDAAGSWSFMGLDDIWVYSLALSPNYITDQTVLAGTAIGVYKSEDGGVNWAEMNQGLWVRDVRVFLFLPTDPRTILAGTAGGGVWAYTEGVSPTTFTPSPSATLTPSPSATSTPTKTPTATSTPTPAIAHIWVPLALKGALSDLGEPNDFIYQAWGPLISGIQYHAYLPPWDVEDFYYIELFAPHSIEIWLRNIPQGTDYNLYLYDATFKLVGYSGNVGNADEHILYADGQPGTYYIGVRRPFQQYGLIQPYLLTTMFE